MESSRPDFDPAGQGHLGPKCLQEPRALARQQVSLPTPADSSRRTHTDLCRRKHGRSSSGQGVGTGTQPWAPCPAQAGAGSWGVLGGVHGLSSPPTPQGLHRGHRNAGFAPHPEKARPPGCSSRPPRHMCELGPLLLLLRLTLPGAGSGSLQPQSPPPGLTCEWKPGNAGTPGAAVGSSKPPLPRAPLGRSPSSAPYNLVSGPRLGRRAGRTQRLFPAPPAGPMVTAAQEGASARSTGDQRWGPFAVAAGPQGTEDAQSAHGQHPPGAGEDPRLGASRTTAEGQGRQGSRRLVRGRAVAWMAQHPYKVTSFIRPVIHSANSAGNQHNLCANNT